MFNQDLLLSPIVASNEPGHQGWYFLVLRSDGEVGQPNGVHIGPISMAEKTMESYLKEGVTTTDTIEEFNKMKDWYNKKVMKWWKHSILDTIDFEQRELLKHIEEGFPKEKQ